MKKLLEIESNEEFRKSLIIQYIFNTLTFTLFLLVRIHDQTFFRFDFYFELVVLFFILRFYRYSHKNKNYAFWGYTVVLFFYILRHILHFTFIDHNIFILYIGFLTALFMAINCYVMSSPLYYPRIQWWEYDFRYRGDLKASILKDGDSFEARMVDLRRECMSVMAFDKLALGELISLEIPYGNQLFRINGDIKTIREDVLGRPISYGISIKLGTAEERKDYNKLLKLWSMHQKVNLRRKFLEMKESKNELSAD